MKGRKILIALLIILTIPLAVSASELIHKSLLEALEAKRYLSPDFESEMESEIFDLINHERNIRLLESLERDPTLDLVAEMHSKDMAKKHYFSHFDFLGHGVRDRLERTDKFCVFLGENLAYNSHKLFGSEERMDGLMNSPSHRGGILNPQYLEVGLSVEKGLENFYLTQVFCG